MTEKKIICPHSQKECIKDGAVVVVDGKPELHACPAWANVQGVDPQSGKTIDRWDCSEFVWKVVLLIENSKMQRETGAAVESFRNEMAKANRATISMLSLQGETVRSLENPAQGGSNLIEEDR